MLAMFEFFQVNSSVLLRGTVRTAETTCRPALLRGYFLAALRPETPLLLRFVVSTVVDDKQHATTRLEHGQALSPFYTALLDLVDYRDCVFVSVAQKK